MKDKMKGTVLIVLTVILIGLGLFLIKTTYQEYSILAFVVSFVVFLVGMNNMFQSSNPEKKYQSNIKNILNTFDSILVKSNSVPELKDRNIIMVESMDDLVDAQLEIRKPICYLKQTESCSFVLLDEKEAYVYVEKLNENVKSPVEIEIKALKSRTKSEASVPSAHWRGSLPHSHAGWPPPTPQDHSLAPRRPREGKIGRASCRERV